MSLAAVWVVRRTAARSRVVGLMPNLDQFNSSAPVAAPRGFVFCSVGDLVSFLGQFSV